MEYEVTANRKRPRSLDGLVGQEFVVASLRNSLQSGRIAHAYLFAGPRGTGKTSAARILARALNCPAGPTPEPCEDYDGSDEIARGAAIDVIEIDGASNTSVNDIRQIKDEVLFAPTTARYKIYIIDEVHMLSNSAFNALLKTIEEPPPYIVFIFATTEIHKVPATIRSRCQQFNFRLIPTDLIAEMLKEAVTEQEITADEGAIFWIAKEGTGSLRDAYTLLDQISSFSDWHITLEKIHDKLGLIGMDNLNDIAEAIAAGDGQQLVELTAETLSRGVSVEQFVIDLAEYFRGVLFVRKGVHKEAILGLPPDRFSANLIRTLSDTQVERALELLLGLYRVIRYSLNPRFDLDLTVSRLGALRDYVTPQEVLQVIQEMRESMTSGDAGRSAPTPTAGEQSDTAVREMSELNSVQVSDVLDKIRHTKLTLASALEKAVEWNIGDTELTIVFDSEYPANAARGEEETIRTAIAETIGRPVLVRIVVRKESASDEEIAAEATHDSQAEMVKRVFRGEIVD